MAKLFKTSDDIYEKINDCWVKTGLVDYGIQLKVMSTSKAKQVFKISKASSVTEFLTREENIITLLVYEEAYEKLSDEEQELLTDGILSIVSYDPEKDKLNIDNTPYLDIFYARGKDKNKGDKYMEALEIAHLAIKQIEQAEKDAQEAKKKSKSSKSE